MTSARPEMSTGVSAADSDAAFSASSAIRWTTSMGGSGYRDVRLHADRDALVLPGLRHRGPDHVHQHHRAVPAARQLMSGQHEQVLRVAAHAGGQVIHGDQARPSVGVQLGLAELVDEPELVFHQGLAAAR